MHHRKKSVFGVLVSRIFGLMCFMLILCVLNFLTSYLENFYFLQFVKFLNSNILLIVVMSLIFLVGELFSVLFFPLNLPAPIFNAIGSIFLMTFIFRIFEFIDSMIEKNVFGIFSVLKPVAYPVVFLIVLFVGYILIFTRLFKCDDFSEEKIQKEKKSKKGEHSWNDVSEEFKEATYDLISLVREKINKRRKKR